MEEEAAVGAEGANNSSPGQKTPTSKSTADQQKHFLYALLPPKTPKLSLERILLKPTNLASDWLAHPSNHNTVCPHPKKQPYDVPIPFPITDRERAQVRSLLLFREQVHDGPLYTATRSWAKTTSSGATTPRAYGQEQINQRYGVKTKATIDPFTAVEMPHSHLRRPERALPDFSDRPFSAFAPFLPKKDSTVFVGLTLRVPQPNPSSRPSSTPPSRATTAPPARTAGGAARRRP